MAVLRGQARLEPWCAARGVEEALVGGFFVRPDGTRSARCARAASPAGTSRSTRPGTRCGRACTSTAAARASRRATSCPPQPRGDLLQAGPLLVRDGERRLLPRATTPRASGAAQAQFDSDITDGRYPRAALGLGDGRLVAVACDGRSRHDAGLTLEELAELLVALGCTTAMNLDGGGSTSLVCGGRLRNRPRGRWERPEPGGRPVSTALLFLPRRT